MSDSFDDIFEALEKRLIKDHENKMMKMYQGACEKYQKEFRSKPARKNCKKKPCSYHVAKAKEEEKRKRLMEEALKRQQERIKKQRENVDKLQKKARERKKEKKLFSTVKKQELEPFPFRVKSPTGKSIGF